MTDVMMRLAISPYDRQAMNLFLTCRRPPRALFHGTPEIEANTDVGARFDLHSADASRDGAFKELLLLEKHLSQEACPECSNKHLSTAIAYLEEARTLLGGDDNDIGMARWLEAARPRLRDNAATVRTIRKRLAIRLGFASWGDSSTHYDVAA